MTELGLRIERRINGALIAEGKAEARGEATGLRVKEERVGKIFFFLQALKILIGRRSFWSQIGFSAEV